MRLSKLKISKRAFDIKHMKKITIFVMHIDSDEEFEQVTTWLKKWKNSVILAD